MNSDVILPVIPETITVHLGRPETNARNVTIPFADYIKNVASSEIYPTWPESALRANILAQISFALNRIYTEYYPSRGYDFDITSSPSIDQTFVYGRDIFENISEIVDEIFNTYIRREGTVSPLFAVYCDGIEVQCGGLTQWGSVELANQGLSAYEILRRFYGDNIEFIENVPVEGVTESYPGEPLRLGSISDEVFLIQARLNRIRRNYPGIPAISDPDGFFSADTEDAVRAFQRQFGLTVDGVVGRATWYAIARIYGAVKRLTDVNSEGVPMEDVTLLFNERLEEGDSGFAVRELQYLLAFISAFDPSVRPVAIDGIFGAVTRGAVEDYQTAYGLPTTGIVNAATWNSLYETYTTLRNSLPADYFGTGAVPYPGSPLRIGSRGADVVTLQQYLNRIAEAYPEIPFLSPDGIYGQATANAVRIYQRLFGLEPVGVTASTTWNSIADTYFRLVNGT